MRARILEVAKAGKRTYNDFMNKELPDPIPLLWISILLVIKDRERFLGYASLADEVWPEIKNSPNGNKGSRMHKVVSHMNACGLLKIEDMFHTKRRKSICSITNFGKSVLEDFDELLQGAGVDHDNIDDFSMQELWEIWQEELKSNVGLEAPTMLLQ